MCPFNRRFAEPAGEPAYEAASDTDGPYLMELMGMTEEEFGERFSGSPVKRAKRRGFLRNVAVALGNWGSVQAVPVLARAMEDDEALVRGQAAHESLPEDLDQFPEFDPTDPEPIPEDHFDQS